MTRKKLTAAAFVIVLVLLFTCACTPVNPPEKPDDDSGEITYQSYDASTLTFQDNHDENLSMYDSNLYYLNEWNLGYNAPGSKGNYFPDMGDPYIVYDDGYYYAFGTRGTTTFHCFRTADFTNWERLDDAFVPKNGSWGTTNLWAPDVQKINGKWYLYYTAKMVVPGGRDHCHIGVAVSDNVYGPYEQWTGTNGNGEVITLADSPFNGLVDHTLLDQTVFQDDGELYMYFSYDTKTGSQEHMDMSKTQNAAEIWGVKLKDPVTWDLSTLKPLISPGYKNFSDAKRSIDWEVSSPSFVGGQQCCEGPYMIKQNGKYFLTYCANSFVDAEYAVGYGVSDKPLGDFTKPSDTKFANMLLGVPGAPGTYISNRYKGFTRGTGHAAIFKTGDGSDYMFAYHAHFNRSEWSDKIPYANWRALAVDYLYFDKDGTPYTNGPTYSLQRTPSDVSGIKNLASQAKIRIEGEHGEYLNDNYTNRGMVADEPLKEAEFKAGTRSIEITFDKEVTVKSLNIFNSCDFEKAVTFIDQIDFGGGNGIVGVQFNGRYIKDDFIFPHSAFNIELGGNGVTTKKIVITITSDADFALGEIEILGN